MCKYTDVGKIPSALITDIELCRYARKKFAKLIGSKYAVGVNSGTDAIKLSLKSLGVKTGDEVITAANTFVATIGAIIELGAKPFLLAELFKIFLLVIISTKVDFFKKFI